MVRQPATLPGFATINYSADDLNAAKRWHAELFGVEPVLLAAPEHLRSLPLHVLLALRCPGRSWRSARSRHSRRIDFALGARREITRSFLGFGILMWYGRD
jgi:hypothetical protein